MMLLNNLNHFSLTIVLYFVCPGSRPSSAVWRDFIPGIEDYQQIRNNTPGYILSLAFDNTRHSQTFNVEIFEDGVPEGVEELNVILSLQDPSLANMLNVTPAVATVRINDSKLYWFP